MRFTSVIVGALVGCTMLFGSAAAALADFTPAGSSTYPGITLTAPGFFFGDTAATASLSDKWFFTFSSPSFLTTADASNSSGAYTNFQLSLYRADSASTSTLLMSGNIASGLKEDSGLGPITLGPGNYYLQLVGTGVVNPDIKFPQVVSGNLNVQAVPVPGALPLFATGLGMLGILASRRRKRVSA